MDPTKKPGAKGHNEAEAGFEVYLRLPYLIEDGITDAASF